MTDDEFDKYMQHAIDNLPDENLKNLDNVVIVVEDWPTPLQLRKGEVKRGTLFGLYEGIPKVKRNNNYSMVAPDKITIFKGPLTRAAVNEDHLQILVDNTVWHEVAHHYGLGHDRIHELERKAQTRRQFSGKVKFETARNLDEAGIIHGWFARRGGVSQAPFASLNVAHGNRDRVEFVEENIRRALAELNLDRDRLVHHATNLSHKDQVFIAKAEHAGKIIQGFDIIMTDVKDLPIALNTADCLPILLYDPKKQVVAVVHAGWRGSQIKVAEKAVKAMSKTYGSKPGDIIAAIGPGAGAESYEVDKEVAHDFDSQFSKAKGEKYLLDLKSVNQAQLEDLGVSNIFVSDTDTIQDENFFSHRRERFTGRNFNVISL